MTLNTRGLNDTTKRRNLFQYLNKYSISCLQEAYITNETCLLWSREWNGDFFYESGTSHSKGLIILVNKNFRVDDLKVIKINDRCLGISFTFLKRLFTIFNIYAPADKEDRVPFFENLSNTLKINELPLDASIIACGDFNSVSNNALDVLTGIPHSENEISAFNSFKQNHNFTDCWRKLNPNCRDFSWIRFNSKGHDTDSTTSIKSCVARRLDYIFCNDNLLTLLKTSCMTHISLTDHKAVTAVFQIDDFPTGPSRWMFNEALLDDDLFMEHMRCFINNYITDTETNTLFDKRLTWDLLKIGIRDECMSFSRQKNLNSILNDLESDIKTLNNELINSPKSSTLLQLLRDKTVQKETFEMTKAKGALKRSRAHHIAENEKNTRYFLGVERSRQSNLIIRSVYNNENVLVDTPGLIINNISNFYKNLLNEDSPSTTTSTPDDLKTFLGEIEHPILNEDERNLLDLPLEKKELDSALKFLNRDSAPGIDGLTPLFYINFWDILREPLFKCFEEAVNCKSLSLSQRRAIISLLPKDTGAALHNLGSWRPISLTCTDYKIYSKVLATRLQKVIRKLIHVNQVGYIPGRSISDHIRLIDDIIHFSNHNNVPGILTSLDFKKAFDTVSKGSITTTLKKFGFGPNFLRYVDTILNETEASVKNGGWLSEWFRTTRGVRQGCVLSPLLFILVVECLAIKIRHDNGIISLLDGALSPTENGTKLIQYADDISLFLKTGKCLSNALNIIDDFKTLTGLTLNRKKSISMCLGGYKIDNENKEGLKWLQPNENMKILGIFFNAKKEASVIKENWESRIEEVKKLMLSWSRRNITLFGRSIVAKTFMISKINHIIQSLALPDAIIDIIDNLIFKFLWMKTDLGKRCIERVKRDTLCLPVDEGGIGMISIRDQQNVMLIRWLDKGCRINHATHYMIINKIFKHIGGINYILNCTAGPKQFKGSSHIHSIFWQKALTAWTKIDKTKFETEVIKVPIFNNSSFLYKGTPLLISQWIKSGCVFYHQLINDNTHQIKTFNEICHSIRPYGGLILDYLAVTNAIRQYHLSNGTVLPARTVTVSKPLLTSLLKLNNKSLRLVFVKQKQQGSTLNCVAFWKRKLNIVINPYFIMASKATTESKLKVLHFKLIHNIYPSNFLLHKMKIKNTNICDYCHEVDFLEHMFVSCQRLKSFWDTIMIIVEYILDQPICMNSTIALFGLLKSSVTCKQEKLNEANHIILLAKFCIVKAKYSPGNQNLHFMFEYELAMRRQYFPTLKEN